MDELLTDLHEVDVPEVESLVLVGKVDDEEDPRLKGLLAAELVVVLETVVSDAEVGRVVGNL